MSAGRADAGSRSDVSAPRGLSFVHFEVNLKNPIPLTDVEETLRSGGLSDGELASLKNAEPIDFTPRWEIATIISNGGRLALPVSVLIGPDYAFAIRLRDPDIRLRYLDPDTRDLIFLQRKIVARTDTSGRVLVSAGNAIVERFGQKVLDFIESVNKIAARMEVDRGKGLLSGPGSEVRLQRFYSELAGAFDGAFEKR